MEIGFFKQDVNRLNISISILIILNRRYIIYRSSFNLINRSKDIVIRRSKGKLRTIPPKYRKASN